MAQTKREELESLGSQLKQKRQSFEPHWQECMDFTLPHRNYITSREGQEGSRVNQRILDSTATMALRTGASGMMSGVTSPARPWKRLTTPDPDLAEWGPAKAWLHTVDRRMGNVFARSNLYQVLPGCYNDLFNVATSPFIVDEDLESVINCTSFPVGTYWISNDHRGRVNVFRREFQMTVRQLIGKFGETKNGKPDWGPFSKRVRDLWDRSYYETSIDVVHTIRPNSIYDRRLPWAKNKKFESCYYEKGLQESKEVYLRESGYDYFPVLCPRWEIGSQTAYGVSCPTMIALGEIKELQFMKGRKAEAIDKMVRPPMVGHPDLEMAGSSILPSSITYLAEEGGQKGFRPAIELNPPLQAMLLDIQDTRQIVSRAYFEDLFLMLSRSDRRQITAREIEERYEEKLLALGPVLEQLNLDLLDPLVDNTFAIMLGRGMIPAPPKELQGQQLRVEYVSVMAQAQKTIGLGGMDRLLGYIGQIAPIQPDIIHKIDFEQFIDEAADNLGISPRIVRTDDDVAMIKQGIAQAQAQAQQAAIAREQAATAKDLSQTKIEDDTALSRMMQQAQAGQMVPA